MLSFHLLRGGSVSLALVVWTFWGRPGKVGASGEWALWTEHKLWNQRAVLSLFVAYSVPQSSSVKWGQSHSAQSHRGTLISLLKSPVPSHQMHSISVSSLLLHWKEQAGNTMLEINSPPPPKKRKKKKKKGTGWKMLHLKISVQCSIFQFRQSYLSRLMGRKGWYFLLSYIAMEVLELTAFSVPPSLCVWWGKCCKIAL